MMEEYIKKLLESPVYANSGASGDGICQGCGVPLANGQCPSHGPPATRKGQAQTEEERKRRKEEQRKEYERMQIQRRLQASEKVVTLEYDHDQPLIICRLECFCLLPACGQQSQQCLPKPPPPSRTHTHTHTHTPFLLTGPLLRLNTILTPALATNVISPQRKAKSEKLKRERQKKEEAEAAEAEQKAQIAALVEEESRHKARASEAAKPIGKKSSNANRSSMGSLHSLHVLPASASIVAPPGQDRFLCAPPPPPPPPVFLWPRRPDCCALNCACRGSRGAAVSNANPPPTKARAPTINSAQAAAELIAQQERLSAKVPPPPPLAFPNTHSHTHVRLVCIVQSV